MKVGRVMLCGLQWVAGQGLLLQKWQTASRLFLAVNMHFDALLGYYNGIGREELFLDGLSI